MNSSQPRQLFSIDTLAVVGLWLLVCLLMALAIFVKNEGKFTYILDDPYIHLAVAEQIASGHYGINAVEFSAPCSSAIWPFLLAPLARLSIGEFMPLLLNVLFGGLTAWVILKRARVILPESLTGRVVVSWAILLCCNSLVLVFTGMEHTLQLLAAIVVVEGMLRITEGNPPGRWFWIAVVAGPLVRYENLALSAVACGLLLFSGRPKVAILAGAGALASLVVFSMFLHGLGLPGVPSSVTAKSQIARTGFLPGVRDLMLSCLMGNRGPLLLIFTATLAAIGLAAGPKTPRGKAALLIAGAGLLHGIFGTYDGYNRYECYIFGATLLGLFGLVPLPLSLGTTWNHRYTISIALFTLVISFPYLLAMSQTPLAGNNIYCQQYQMHRFATDWWKRPVAVNDLGWVSYRNDDYVLDLWGLGSHVALENRLKNKSWAWAKTMTREKNVDLAIIYQAWVPGKSIGWTKVGELKLEGKRITPAQSVVGFFATSPEVVPELESLLIEFRETLPPGATLVTRTEALAARDQGTPETAPQQPDS